MLHTKLKVFLLGLCWLLNCVHTSFSFKVMVCQRSHIICLNTVVFETPTIWALSVSLQQAITLDWNEI